MIRRVACINRRDLKTEYQKEKLILVSNLNDLEDDFKDMQFGEKNELEQNENFKQIIPYVILKNQFNQIAIYQRQGTEKRLHGLWSAGFGGHIEDYEYKESQKITTLLKESAVRELREEFSNNEWYKLNFEGVINEEFTKVGRTHIALVFSTKVNEILFESSEEISQIKWIDIEDLSLYQMELWSEMAIELISKN